MGLGAWDSPEREKRRDFARDGRAETGETMPSPRAPSRRLSSPLSFVRALGFRGFFFLSGFLPAFRRFEGKKVVAVRGDHIFTKALWKMCVLFPSTGGWEGTGNGERRRLAAGCRQ